LPKPKKQSTIFTKVFTYALSSLLGNDHLRSQPKTKNTWLPISLKIALQNICIGVLWGFLNKSCFSRLQPSLDLAGVQVLHKHTLKDRSYSEDPPINGKEMDRV